MSLFASGGDPLRTREAEELRQRLRADPHDVAAALSLSALLARHGQRAEAVALLSRTGTALLRKGRLVETVAAWKRALEIDPKGEVPTSFLVGIELKKLEALAAPAAPAPAAPSAAPDPKAVADSAAHRAKAQAVRAAAAGIPLLKDVPPFLLELVLDRVTLGAVPQGTMLFGEGSEGSSLLFIVAGEVEVLAAGHPIARLSPGDVAGEISFLSGTPRTATLRAATEVHVLELDRKAVEPILKKHRALGEALAALYRERVLDGVLARSRAFGVLPPEAREALARRMAPRTAKAGDVLVKEGGSDDAMFLIRRGQARVTRRTAVREAALAMLGPHDVFGDVAALRGTARTATVTAVTPMELLVLSRAALQELLPSAPGLAAALEEIQIERFVASARILQPGPPPAG